MRPTTSLALVSLLCAGAEAQSASNATVSGFASSVPVVGNASSTSAPTPTATTIINTGSNPLIPSAVSTACQTYLEVLNADASITACTAPLLATLSLFVPSTASSSYAATDAQVSESLSAFCTTDACSPSLMRSTLTKMETACATELQDRNEVVLGVYDAIYVVSPLLAAVCSQDSTGEYCLKDIVSGNVPTSTAPAASSSSLADANSTSLAVNTTSTSTSTFNIETYAQAILSSPAILYTAVRSTTARLFRRGSATDTTASATNTTTNSSTVPSAVSTKLTGVLPSADLWNAAQVPFVFLTPNMSSSIVCTACTKSVFTAYVEFEMAHPYSIGLANSPLLGGQGKLWTGLGTTCGSGFIASIATAAGQSSSLEGDASFLHPKATASIMIGIVAAFALLV